MSHNRFFGFTAIALTFFVASPARIASQEVITQKAISLNLAQAMAQAALDKCRSQNYHVVVVVLDASGIIKVLIRDDGSGPTNADAARRVAYTALAFHGTSGEQLKVWETRKIPNIGPDRAPVAGGVPIKVGNEVIGAIGVGGAHAGERDEVCALAGVAKYADKLK